MSYLACCEAGKGSADVISWNAAGFNFGGCKCDCDGKASVQLMAIQKIVKVPKIKIHDFGKKEDWDIDGRVQDLDLGYQSPSSSKYKMKVRDTDLTTVDSGWQLAGKYDVEHSNWNFDKSNMNLDLSFI
ncbi:hypothetical protein HDE_01385 [Halotydeus destructor]|nr:hypothetical protein HDE_01385 [Halotydeus destructor]